MSQDPPVAERFDSFPHGLLAVSARLFAGSPLIAPFFGASVTFSALAAYLSTGSPRWKGAPSLSKKGEYIKHHNRCSGSARSGVPTGVSTSTKKPWATTRAEITPKNEIQEVEPVLCVNVRNLDSPHLLNGVYQQQTDHDCDNPLEQVQKQQHSFQHYRSSSGATAIYDFCFPTSSTQVAASLFPGAASSLCLFRNWSGCCSTSSGANTPTTLLSSLASRSGLAQVSPGGGVSLHSCSGEGCVSKISGSEPMHLAFLSGTESVISGAMASANKKSPSTEQSEISTVRIHQPSCCNSCFNTRCRILSKEESLLVSRGYNWSRQLGKSENVSGGKLRQTLSHLVGAVAVSCSVREKLSHTCGEEEVGTYGRHPPSLGGMAHSAVGIDLNHRSAEVAAPKEKEQTRILYSGYIEGERTRDKRKDRNNVTNRMPHLEAQLRSLERRLEQQISASMGRCATGDLKAGCYVESVTTAAVQKSDSDNIRSEELAQRGGDTALSQIRPDRRIDDVFVRQRGDGMSTYSLSLTYHDAGGIPRTIDTHMLPPLKLPPRPSIASSTNKLVTGMTGARLQASSTSSMQEDAQSAERPLVRTWDCGVKSSDGGSSNNSISSSCHFVAPLPPLDPVTGPHLEGVAGRRGELRIGAFLGGGWCGKVYECLNTETGEVLAAKQILLNAKDPKLRQKLKQLELELEVLTMAARHRMPWIVGFHGAEKRGHSVLLYLEYCARGSLLDYAMSSGHPSQASPSSVVSMNNQSGHGNDENGHISKGLFRGDLRKPHQQDQNDEHPSYHQKCHHHDHGSCGSSREGDIVAKGSHLMGGAIVSDAGKVNPFETSEEGFWNADDVRLDTQALPITEVQCFTQQLVNALHFLHSHGYAHLDVKTGNILVTENRDVRLADFGCSMRLRRGIARTGTSTPLGEGLRMQHHDTGVQPAAPVSAGADGSAGNDTLPYPVLAEVDDITELRGTALYMAPEMIRFESGRIGAAGDVWSLGCVVMELATGAAPWCHVAKDKLRVLFRIGSSREELPLPPSIVRAAEGARLWLKNYTSFFTNAGATSSFPGTSVLTEFLPPFPSTATVFSAEGEDDGAGFLKRSRLDDEGKATEAAGCKGNNVLPRNRASWASQHRRMLLFVALEDFLGLCLRIRPEDRPSCEELLQHPLLTIA